MEEEAKEIGGKGEKEEGGRGGNLNTAYQGFFLYMIFLLTSFFFGRG